MGSSLVLNNLMHLQLNTTQTQPVCHDGREALRKPDSNAGSSTLTRPPTPRLLASILSICSVLPQTCYQQEQVYRTGHLGFGGARLFQGVVEKAEMGGGFPHVRCAQHFCTWRCSNVLRTSPDERHLLSMVPHFVSPRSSLPHFELSHVTVSVLRLRLRMGVTEAQLQFSCQTASHDVLAPRLFSEAIFHVWRFYVNSSLRRQTAPHMCQRPFLAIRSSTSLCRLCVGVGELFFLSSEMYTEDCPSEHDADHGARHSSARIDIEISGSSPTLKVQTKSEDLRHSS